MFNAIHQMLDTIDIYQFESDCLEAPLFGFQPIEVIWEIKNDLISLAELKARPQESFVFDTNNQLLFRTSSATTQPIPDFKIILFQHEANALTPYGHSLLAKCYWPVTFKNGGLRFWVEFTEKYGMPILLGQYQRGATNEEIRALAEQLESIYEDAIIVSPMDVKLELHEPNSNSSVDLYLELIRFANSEISKAILSQTLTTELEGGSYAASQTHFQIRKEIILADIHMVQNAVNTLIRYFGELNFPNQPLPKFKIIIL